MLDDTPGYYDHVFRGPKGIRRLWHVSKFERVLDCLPAQGRALLDVGCFAGTFLSTVPRERFGRQLGIDILPQQIAYASRHHGSPYRQFRLGRTRDLLASGETFDAITGIELVEHLQHGEIATLLDDARQLLAPGGSLVFTTPNYTSTWPLLERAISWSSGVNYTEQHLTRFTYLGLERQLARIEPSVWRHFELIFKTTTHFVTPFLGALSYDLARAASRIVPHAGWRNPFGNLILAMLRRREQLLESAPLAFASQR